MVNGEGRRRETDLEGTEGGEETEGTKGLCECRSSGRD